MNTFTRLIARAAGLCGHVWHNILSRMNALGSLLLAYALMNRDAVTDFVAYIPTPLKPFVPLLAFAWFGLVQYALKRSKQSA